MQKSMKKILAFVAMVAFCNQVAIAQSEKELSEEEIAQAILKDSTKVMFRTLKEAEFTISTGDSVVGVDKDGKQVIAHAGDTIYTYAYRYFWRNGLRKAPKVDVSRLKKTEIVRDEVLWSKLKKAAVETQFAEAMASSSGRERDTKWDEVTDGRDTLRIVRHGIDKNHWYVAAQGDYQISEGCNGFGATLDVQYWSDSFWFGEVGSSITRNMMYELAEDAGANYTSYAGHAIGGAKFDFGRRENFTLVLYGGLEATWQKTNSREFTDEYGNTYMMKSTHSNYAPVAGAMVRYRFPDSRVAIFARGEWSQKAYTYQNAENERHNAFKVSAGVSIGLHGNVVKTK